jgi:hypothetical protein
MIQSSIATAADCADAMLTARRARNLLFTGLLIILLAQLTLFFMIRFTSILDGWITPNGGTLEISGQSISIISTSQPVAESTTPFKKEHLRSLTLQYVIGLMDFLGIVFAIVLSFVLMFMVLVMVVGRLIGVSYVTSACLLCGLLTVLLFPWQAFLNNAGLTGQEWRIPGVLYTWNELSQHAHFSNTDLKTAILKWARFVGFPVVSIILLILVQVKSNTGLRIALGEEEVIPVESGPAAEHP